MRIVAGDKHFRELNEEINTCPDAEIELDNVCGQRYICSGLSGKKVTIHGIPGNALCCYLDGCDVEVLGNAQDATGDTMNSGTLTIHGPTAATRRAMPCAVARFLSRGTSAIARVST